jgi:hypothetical protein
MKKQMKWMEMENKVFVANFKELKKELVVLAETDIMDFCENRLLCKRKGLFRSPPIFIIDIMDQD